MRIAALVAKTNQLGRGSVLVLVLAFLSTACSGVSEPTTNADIHSFDPAEWMGLAQYAVVLDVSEPSRAAGTDHRRWIGTVRDVVWSADLAWTRGARLPVALPVVGVELEFLASDKIEVDRPVMLIAVMREIEEEGGVAPVPLALLVMDASWIPVEGTHGPLIDGIEAAVSVAKAPSRADAIEELLDAALEFNHQLHESINPQVSDLIAAVRTEADVASAEVVADDTDELGKWLEYSSETRQLPSEIVDLPEGAGQALGIDWAWREAAVASDPDFSAKFNWIGIHFPDVGLIGPVFVNPAPEPTVIVGWGPDTGSAEIVAWESERPEPGKHQVIALIPTWESPAGSASAAAWVHGGADEATVELLERPDYDIRLTVASSAGDDSEIVGGESQNPDAADLIDR